MISQQLQPDEIFQFVDILNRSTKGDFLPDLSEDSQEIHLLDKLSSCGLVNAKRKANNGIHVALLTETGKVAAQEARQWVENQGRQGEVQLALFDYLKESNGQSPSNLIGQAVSNQPLTEDELYEAVDALEKVGAISIPNGTSNGGAHGLPLRASHNPAWSQRMKRRQAPAWYNLQMVPVSQNIYNQPTTNNFSGITESQIAIGDNAQQTQNNSHGLSAEDVARIGSFFRDLRDQIEEKIADAEQREALLALAERAENELLAAETQEESKSIRERFLEHAVPALANEGAHALVAFIFQAWPLLAF